MVWARTVKDAHAQSAMATASAPGFVARALGLGVRFMIGIIGSLLGFLCAKVCLYVYPKVGKCKHFSRRIGRSKGADQFLRVAMKDVSFLISGLIQARAPASSSG